MKGLYDIHTHIIPHVDDGAIRLNHKRSSDGIYDGVRTIFATSHFRRRMFEAPMERSGSSIFRFSRQQKRLHRISGSFWDASFTPIWIW